MRYSSLGECAGKGSAKHRYAAPSFAHARRNSKLVAVVSDAKRREIKRRYVVDHAFSYEQFRNVTYKQEFEDRRSDCLLHDLFRPSAADC